MKKILIPTDFSNVALNAIEYALKLFEHDFCRFYILYAYQQDIYESGISITKEILDQVSKTASENSQKQLHNLLKRIKKSGSNPKHTYKIISANNILIDEVDIIVDERDLDLVVMGTHGKTNNKKLTFGSHTLQVLKYVKCPVLVIPENYKYVDPKKIIFSTDYSMPCQKRELNFLSELASDFQSQIDVLHVSKKNSLSLTKESNKHSFKESFRNSSTSFITIEGENIVEAINLYIEKHNTEMLVMINRRHSFLEFILFQDTVNKIGLTIHIPFLALQNIKRN